MKKEIKVKLILMKVDNGICLVQSLEETNIQYIVAGQIVLNEMEKHSSEYMKSLILKFLLKFLRITNS